jgi:hypothetical protein
MLDSEQIPDAERVLRLRLVRRALGVVVFVTKGLEAH